MNISIENEHISVSGLNSTGETFEVVDSIGFSEANLDEGFNRDAAAYEDADTVVYPKLDEAVLILYAYLNKYDADPVPAGVTGTIVRASSDAIDYANVRYTYDVSIVGDGWYTVYGFLMDVDPVDTSGVYYASATGLVMDNAVAVTVASLMTNENVEKVILEVIVSPALEKDLAKRVGELADLGKQKGPCSKEYKKLQQSVFYMDGQLAGARVQFEDGHRYEAQETIEDLTSGDPYVNC